MATQAVAPQTSNGVSTPEARAEARPVYRPRTDVYETADAVVVSMEVPGVDKSSVDIRLDKGVLTVKANVDADRYAALQPVYAEYDFGNFVRTFTVSPKIDVANIAASLADGVLTIHLPKASEAIARRIAVH